VSGESGHEEVAAVAEGEVEVVAAEGGEVRNREVGVQVVEVAEFVALGEVAGAASKVAAEGYGGGGLH
jgi:hypothetical protein